FTRPENPTNAVGSRAYDFAGWYTDAACTKEYDFATKATGDLKLYAKWLPSTCTLVFDSMGGSHVDGATAKYGEAATRPADPTRPHYRFKGWYEDEQCTRAYDFATKLTEESRTVYAKWGDYDECHVWDEGEVTDEERIPVLHQVLQQSRIILAVLVFPGLLPHTDPEGVLGRRESQSLFFRSAAQRHDPCPGVRGQPGGLVRRRVRSADHDLNSGRPYCRYKVLPAKTAGSPYFQRRSGDFSGAAPFLFCGNA
ncbi:MAG: InlB B-repeat-containing protein, partial [Bacteroidales bacterium]